jgi:hypothetical protein
MTLPFVGQKGTPRVPLNFLSMSSDDVMLGQSRQLDMIGFLTFYFIGFEYALAVELEGIEPSR